MAFKQIAKLNLVFLIQFSYIDANCYWKSPKEYLISFCSKNGYLKYITIKGGIIYSAYIYAQNPMNETTIELLIDNQEPQREFKVRLIAPKWVSPKTTLTMSIITMPFSDFSWSFIWNIKYEAGVYSEEIKSNVEKSFEEFKQKSSLMKVISIPSNYLLPNSILKVTINAFNNYSSAPYVEETIVNISDEDEIPVVEFR